MGGAHVRASQETKAAGVNLQALGDPEFHTKISNPLAEFAGGFIRVMPAGIFGGNFHM
jgi:hypothetical protein